MLVSMVVCPTCGDMMHAGPAKVNDRYITFTLMCFGCPLITELTPGYPARLCDLHNLTMQEASEQGIGLTALTRTATPVTNVGRES